MHRSVAVILSAGGSPLDHAALDDLPGGRVVRAEFAWGERAACVAATVDHEAPPAEWLAALGPWARGRGWSVTIAPLRRRH